MVQVGAVVSSLQTRIEMAVVEEINRMGSGLHEPGASIPEFVRGVTERLLEITEDEIHFRRY